MAGESCNVDEKVLRALQEIPADGLEYFYSKWRMTSNATPAFIAQEMELFRAKIGDSDQGFGPSPIVLTYAQTNMTLQGKLPKRALLRELGFRVHADLIPADRLVIANLRMVSDVGVKRNGDDFTRLGILEDWLAGPDLGQTMSVLQQAAPAATPLQYGALWSTAGCGARPLHRPVILERDATFAVYLNQRSPIVAAAAGEIVDIYAKIGVQWLE